MVGCGGSSPQAVICFVMISRSRRDVVIPDEPHNSTVAKSRRSQVSAERSLPTEVLRRRSSRELRLHGCLPSPTAARPADTEHASGHEVRLQKTSMPKFGSNTLLGQSINCATHETSGIVAAY